MRRLGAFVGVALVLTACGADGPAATVNGTEIDVAEVEALLYDPTDLTDQDLADFLGVLVQWRATEDAARTELGVDPTEPEIDAEIESLLAEVGLAGRLDAFLSSQNISETGIRLFAKQLIIEDALSTRLEPGMAEPTQDQVQQVLDEQLLDLAEVCAAHILVASAAEADAVLDRLETGEDFGAVAEEVSLDSGSAVAGGDLGCAAPSGYVAEFADATMAAEIGQVTDPVETQFGFHVILVTARTTPSEEDVRDVLRDQALAAEIEAWYRDTLIAADITVDERYGTWVTDPLPQVVPPE